MTCPRCSREFLSAQALGVHRGKSAGCRATDLEVLFRFVPERPPGECWLWEGHVTPFGYGGLSRDGVAWVAHRWVFETRRGEIPDGYDLHHLCEQRLCVNPDHLVPLSRQEHNDLTHRGIVCETLRAIQAGDMPVPF
jgi:hypothetical protein